MNNSNLSLPNVVDGITGSNNIVNMWKAHYEDLFNCIKKDKNVNDFCKTVDYEMDMEVSHSDIIQAIQDLKDSKSCGLDGISIQFNSLFQTHLRSISHNYMSQHNRQMQKQHINDSLCGLAYTLASVMDIYIYILNRNGDRIPPCLTPLDTVNFDETELSDLTHI